MTDHPVFDCAAFEDAAAELALGVLTGADRARALDHAARCARCRGRLDDLAAVADALLLIAPVTEPPVGFEAAVIAKLEPPTPPVLAVAPSAGREPVPPAWPPPPPRWHRTIRVLAAAAALVLVAGGAALLGRRTAPKADRLAREYTPAIRALGGRSLQAAALRTPTGARAGEVFLYDGAHPWCMARVDGAAGAGPLTMQLVLEDGAVVTPGRFTTAGDNASWAGDIPSTPSPITAVRIVDDTGALRYHADVDAS